MECLRLQIKSAEFIKSAAKPVGYPPGDLPEVAFAGRSNVGKSSLINVLVNRRGLVRTSSTPGRTQLLNFFEVNQHFMLVDLPGFGFAKVPVSVKKAWGRMTRTYLEERTNLKAVVLLFDIRREPRDEELQLLDWLEELNIPTIPVITKVDKVTKNRRRAQIRPILEATGLPQEAFSFFSALTREGREDILQRLDVALSDVEDEFGIDVPESE
nr:ribosome biogenesis GTP-binding protein YihA/YsxC [Syntrophotalea carbinolica]